VEAASVKFLSSLVLIFKMLCGNKFNKKMFNFSFNAVLPFLLPGKQQHGGFAKFTRRFLFVNNN
jgi:hypothetical protein